MPTRPGSDLVPLRKETKERLAALKGSRSYDEVLRALLDAADPGELRSALHPRRCRTPPQAQVERAWREPDKQLLIAALAEEGWRNWRRTGRVKDLGPRAVSWKTVMDDEEELQVAWTGRRGLPA